MTKENHQVEEEIDFFAKEGKYTSEYADYADELMELYQQYDVPKGVVPKKGDVIRGKILNQQDKNILVDAGLKDVIFIEIKGDEYQYFVNKEISIGDEVDVLITYVKDNPFEIRGSVTELLKTYAKENQLKDENQVLDAYVKELTPAGYFVDIQFDDVKIPAFMPNTLAGINKLPDPHSIVNTNVKVMLETDVGDSYIVSRKKYLKTQVEEEIKKIQVGELYQGFVTGTTQFGVFVEFHECLTGMIHKANINPEFKGDIKNIPPGTPIDFYVKEIHKNNKIILTQVWRESMWDKINVGDEVTGKVREKKNFGVLVSLDEETMGLIQNSKLIKNQLPDEGENIKVKVTSVQKSDRKIFLEQI